MMPVYQDKFGLDWTKPDAGNCLQACLASVLEVALDAVPHFVVLEDHHDAMNRWLLEHYGLYVLAFPSTGPEPWAQGYYLQSGKGPRGAEHIVVMKDGELAHDPIGENGPGLSEVTCTWVFVSPEPKLAKVAR